MNEPLVPVIDIEYSPAVELEQAMVAVPGEGGMVKPLGLGEQLAAPGAEMLRLTVPLPPLIGFTVTANVAVDPMLLVWVAGLATMLKSVGTMKDAVVDHGPTLPALSTERTRQFHVVGNSGEGIVKVVVVMLLYVIGLVNEDEVLNCRL